MSTLAIYMRLIDGCVLAAKIRQELKEKISASRITPGLGVILVGDDPASHLYVKLKERACKKAGIYFEKHLFSADAIESEIIKKIKQLNNLTIIHGILVQLPLPPHLDADRIISVIKPDKDADGFHPENIRALKANQPFVEPVLAKAIWELITTALHRLITTSLGHLNTLIIGNSDVFTGSLEAYLKQKGLKASHLHPDQIKNIQYFDIVIVAVGQPSFLKGDDFKDGAIVIDVGTNRLPDGRVVGDVDFESTKQKNGWITPVPGGVGPVTVAVLLENVYFLATRHP